MHSHVRHNFDTRDYCGLEPIQLCWYRSLMQNTIHPITNSQLIFHGFKMDVGRALLAIATLKDHLEKKSEQPLFLALGFTKPHLDFNAPKKYWDLYDREKIKLANNYYPPRFNPDQNVSAKEFNRYGRTAGDVKRTKEFQAEARHAYYACVSLGER